MPKVSNTFRYTGSSCAACTYNRKRCQPWCEYAQIFRDVISRQDYRTIFTVFGVKNVADILQNIPEYQHLETLYSFLFEAKARIENPIKGCTALLASLEQKVEELQERVTALEARSEGGPSCVNPLCSFAPPRGSSSFMASSSRITDLEKGYANTVLEDEEKSELRAINQSEEKWLRYSVLKAEIGVAKTALDGMAVDRPFTKAEPLNKATSTKFTTRKKGEADIGGKIGNEGEKGGRHQSHPLLIRTMVQDSLTNLKELSLRTQKRRHNDINNDEYTPGIDGANNLGECE
ncbi:hypothetical protein LguiB_028792 [Lonicera macranthoides]